MKVIVGTDVSEVDERKDETGLPSPSLPLSRGERDRTWIGPRRWRKEGRGSVQRSHVEVDSGGNETGGRNQFYVMNLIHS